MKTIFELVFILLLAPGMSLASSPSSTGTRPGPCPAGDTIPGDSTRHESNWQERVRQAEAAEIRRENPRRETLSQQSWTTTEIGERENRTRRITPRLSAFSLRANLTRWLTLTPDLSAEWRVNHRWALLAGGSWTSWSWNNKERRYALWNVTAEGRYYPGPTTRWHTGLFFTTGEFNYKFGKNGKQGSYLGGGLAGGYRLPLGRRLSLDFNLGIGYTRADHDKYTLVNKARVRGPNVKKNYWGVNRAGINLEFRI